MPEVIAHLPVPTPAPAPQIIGLNCHFQLKIIVLRVIITNRAQWHLAIMQHSRRLRQEDHEPKHNIATLKDPVSNMKNKNMLVMHFSMRA